MNPTGQIESTIYNDNIINVAGLIYDEISIHGRATLDEICRNIGDCLLVATTRAFPKGSTNWCCFRSD